MTGLCTATALAGAILVIAQPGSTSSIQSYADLMQAPPGQRAALFAGLTPERRAAIKAEHMEIWLSVHRPDLSKRQVELVREAIAFVTPELYAAAPTPAMRERQSRLAQRLGCALNGDLAYSLAQFSRAPERIHRGWRQRAHDWMEWVVNCVL